MAHHHQDTRQSLARLGWLDGIVLGST